MRHAGIATVSLFLLSSVCLILASEIPNTTATDRLPSIAELEQLSFTPTDPNSMPNLPYTEVPTARGLFWAYGAGLEAVSRYRDPVLTRGISGVAVFKTVAPAVVVV